MNDIIWAKFINGVTPLPSVEGDEGWGWTQSLSWFLQSH